MRRCLVLGMALVLGACSSDDSNSSSTGGTAGSGATGGTGGAGATGGASGGSAGEGGSAGSSGAAGGAAGSGGAGGSAGAGGSTNPNCIAFRDTCVSWHRVFDGAKFVHGYAADGRIFGTELEQLAGWSTTGSPLSVTNTDTVTGPLLVSGSLIAFRVQGSSDLSFYDYDAQQTTSSSVDGTSEFIPLGNGNYVDGLAMLEIDGRTGNTTSIPPLPTLVPQNVTSFPTGNGEALVIGQDVTGSDPSAYKLMHYAGHAWKDHGTLDGPVNVRAFLPARRELLLDNAGAMTSIVFDATYSSFTTREWTRQTAIGSSPGVAFKGADVLVQYAVQNGSGSNVQSGLYDVDADRLDSLPLPVDDPLFLPLFAFGDSAYWGNLTSTWRMDYGK